MSYPTPTVTPEKHDNITRKLACVLVISLNVVVRSEEEQITQLLIINYQHIYYRPTKAVALRKLVEHADANQFD